MVFGFHARSFVNYMQVVWANLGHKKRMNMAGLKSGMTKGYDEWMTALIPNSFMFRVRL